MMKSSNFEKCEWNFSGNKKEKEEMEEEKGAKANKVKFRKLKKKLEKFGYFDEIYENENNFSFIFKILEDKEKYMQNLQSFVIKYDECVEELNDTKENLKCLQNSSQSLTLMEIWKQKYFELFDEKSSEETKWLIQRKSYELKQMNFKFLIKAQNFKIQNQQIRMQKLTDILIKCKKKNSNFARISINPILKCETEDEGNGNKEERMQNMFLSENELKFKILESKDEVEFYQKFCEKLQIEIEKLKETQKNEMKKIILNSLCEQQKSSQLKNDKKEEEQISHINLDQENINKVMFNLENLQEENSLLKIKIEEATKESFELQRSLNEISLRNKHLEKELRNYRKNSVNLSGKKLKQNNSISKELKEMHRRYKQVKREKKKMELDFKKIKKTRKQNFLNTATNNMFLDTQKNPVIEKESSNRIDKNKINEMRNYEEKSEKKFTEINDNENILKSFEAAINLINSQNEALLIQVEEKENENLCLREQLSIAKRQLSSLNEIHTNCLVRWENESKLLKNEVHLKIQQIEQLKACFSIPENSVSISKLANEEERRSIEQTKLNEKNTLIKEELEDLKNKFKELKRQNSFLEDEIKLLHRQKKKFEKSVTQKTNDTSKNDLYACRNKEEDLQLLIDIQNKMQNLEVNDSQQDLHTTDKHCNSHNEESKMLELYQDNKKIKSELIKQKINEQKLKEEIKCLKSKVNTCTNSLKRSNQKIKYLKSLIAVEKIKFNEIDMHSEEKKNEAEKAYFTEIEGKKENDKNLYPNKPKNNLVHMKVEVNIDKIDRIEDREINKDLYTQNNSLSITRNSARTQLQNE